MEFLVVKIPALNQHVDNLIPRVTLGAIAKQKGSM